MSNTPKVTTEKFHCNIPREVKAAMRAALRSYVVPHNNKFRDGDLAADVILEGIWNAAMGNQ